MNMANFGKSNRNVAFNPTSAFPLDARSYFDSYSAALAAAQSAKEAGNKDTVYYYGETICVVADNSATLYIINPPENENAKPTLKEVGSATAGDNKTISLENGILSLRGFDKEYYAIVRDPETGDPVLDDNNNVTYEKKAGKFVGGLEPKMVSENGQVVLAWFEPNPTTVTGVASLVATLQTTVSNNSTALTTLVGNDSGKSARTIANEELAARLLSNSADSDFKTLQELASWLENHPESAAAMNEDISRIKDLLGHATTDGDEGTGIIKRIEDIEKVYITEANLTQIKEDINNLKTTVGDSKEGLVKNVADLEDIIGDSTEGLVKNVADNSNNISDLTGRVGDLETASSGQNDILSDVKSRVDSLFIDADENGTKEERNVYLKSEVYSISEADDAINTRLGTGDKTAAKYVEDAISKYDAGIQTDYAKKTYVADAISNSGHATVSDLEAHKNAKVSEETNAESIHLSLADREKWDDAISKIDENQVNTIQSAAGTILVSAVDKEINIDLVWGSFQTT